MPNRRNPMPLADHIASNPIGRPLLDAKSPLKPSKPAHRPREDTRVRQPLSGSVSAETMDQINLWADGTLKPGRVIDQMVQHCQNTDFSPVK